MFLNSLPELTDFKLHDIQAIGEKELAQWMSKCKIASFEKEQ